MRIIETVFPVSVPGTPRVFTLEVTEDELITIEDGLWVGFDRRDADPSYRLLADQVSDALDP